MRVRIENKLIEILDYITKKPVEQITNEDYLILSAELRRFRYDEETAEKNKHLAEAMTAAFGSSCCSLPY